VRDAIRKGRAEWLAPFLSLTEDEAWRTLPAPDDSQVFRSCVLNFCERQNNCELYALHIDLLKLRREDPRFREQSNGGIDGAVIGPASFVLRYFSANNEDRLLLVNFGESQVLHPASEPLLAPPESYRWQTLWTSESPRYGGAGSDALSTAERWALPAESTLVLKPVP
jgi:maltooligosyltrehalose trehalohydrolase